MKKRIIAFDFDGVICDGQQEYFHSAWLGYQVIWQPIDIAIAEQIRPQFYRLRPVIETGWEMILLIRALLLETPEEKIWQDWHGVLTDILRDTEITPQQLMQTLDQVRDRQISEQLDQWLELHHFYDGILVSLKKLLTNPEIVAYIITTKEARFTHQLLINQGVKFSRENIFGKETKQNKATVLKQLISDSDKNTEIWFIEDRLQTLQKIQQDPELSQVKLFLADWGYNTLTERKIAAAQNFSVVNLNEWQQQMFLEFS